MRFDSFHCFLGRMIQRAEREDSVDPAGRTLLVLHLNKKSQQTKPKQTKPAPASPYNADAFETNITLKKKI